MKSLDSGRKKFCWLHGDRQLEYANYDPTNVYDPVDSHDSIRMLLSMAANEDLLLKRADISNAYLYCELDMPIINKKFSATNR